MDREELERKIWMHALRNAILHEGEARVSAVLGGVMSEYEDLEPKEVIDEIQEVIKEVNDLPVDVQENEAEKLGVSLETEKEESDELPEIPKEEEGAVITRMAPNPNGPLHIGSARPALLSYLYAERNDGRFVLRFDDTDPSTPEKSPKEEFYKWIEEDLEWLGCEPDLIIKASERLDTYYEFAYELLEGGHAYICTCDSEEWRKIRDDQKACPCRELSREENIKRWQKMQDGDYDKGEAVMRIKTEIDHKDPAQRDWPAFRVLKNHHHPHVSQDYIVWPLYNFSSAIDDHELNITHILRAQEHAVNTEKQKWIYKYFDWDYPVAAHHGFLSVKGAVLSTSTIRQGIDSGKYKGWDDPRLGTLRAIRKRGFQPETFHQLIRKFGPKSRDAEISMETLKTMNRKIVDPEAPRYFFLEDPLEIEVENPLKEGEVELPVHPEKEGTRSLEAGEKFYIEEKDLEENRGETIRLKDLYNIKIPEEGYDCECVGNEIVQEMAKVQWLPGDEQAVSVEVVMPDASEKKGLAERNVLKEDVDNVLQFERFGFVRMDEKGEKSAKFYYTHS
ncbi:MAG: glutamate--tRNA ligase [Candidatus Aenigmatarchaeota archaeon]